MTKRCIDSREALQSYYANVMPVHAMCQWLRLPTRGVMREWAFVSATGAYNRKERAYSAACLRARLVQQVPSKLEIGPVFRHLGHRNDDADVHWRELAFDIDLTDYDGTRNCCAGAEICATCWIMAAAAVRLTHAWLTRSWDYRHVLWVYSGRRGVHCWASDAVACGMSSQQRRDMLSTIDLGIKGDAARLLQTGSLAGVSESHRHMAMQELRPFFDALLRRPGFRMCHAPHLFVAPSVQSCFVAEPDGHPVDVFESFCLSVGEFERTPERMALPGAYSVLDAVERIVFAHVYPRFDAAVTVQIRHLLKAPFCVHPATGQVCVAFDPNDGVMVARARRAPTLQQLSHEPRLLRPFLLYFAQHVRAIAADQTWEPEQFPALVERVEWDAKPERAAQDLEHAFDSLAMF